MTDLPNIYDSNDFCEVVICNQDTLLVRATDAYIPIEDFKDIFKKIGELVKKEGYSRLIFDKQNLMVFHQPSMVWYFINWKEEMYQHGLKTHRKILPKDPVFRECVKLGRENLALEYPEAKFHEMDIQYRNSVEEAIAS